VKISTTEEEFLKNVVKHFTVSPTGLNTYLKCPYKFKLDRLFLIPKIRERPLAFGTSIHKALEDFFRTYANTGSYLDFELAINSFKKELERQLLSKKDFDDLILRGPQILKDYLSEVIKNKIDVLGTEYNFGSRNVYFEGTKLTGKVDRIDFIDRDRKEVEVIDYKTGHAKSMNEILGKTKNSDLDYKRQLVFYKLLSQLDTTFNKNVISTKLEFVESDGGKFKSINYQVTEDDLIDLKNTIRNVIDRIKKLEFGRTTEYKHCENCQYREHCWPDKVPDSSDNLANS
jgi:DNA helicase-2/ATP-dependent DNA helicase PcrA